LFAKISLVFTFDIYKQHALIYMIFVLNIVMGSLKFVEWLS